jgi:ABC-2 type transport system ATP-binding protein
MRKESTMLNCTNVEYSYQSFKKSQGLLGSLKDFRKRESIQVHAVSDFNLNVEQGEIIGLLGPNGAGKTTLLKMLSGILEQKGGTITCAGHVPFLKEKAYLKSIGVVLGQKSQLLWDLPALETLEMLRVMYEIDKSAYQAKLERMLTLLNLQEKRDIPVRKLSLGERVKFEIICALIHSPKIVYLDEPTIGLDLSAQRNIHQFLREINQEEGTTIVLTSHYMKDIEALCNRVVVMIKGRKQEDTTISELISRFHNDECFVLTFRESVPQELGSYKQRDERTIECQVPELTKLLSLFAKHEEIQSIQKEEVPFEEIIFQLYAKGREEVS